MTAAARTIRHQPFGPRIDLAGKRFGRLIVTAYAQRGSWSCVCSCGARGVVRGDLLRGIDELRLTTMGFDAREVPDAFSRACIVAVTRAFPDAFGEVAA